MKKYFILLASAVVCLGILPAYSQSGSPGGPRLAGATSRLFGDNQTFSAALEMQVADKSGKPMSMPGLITYDTGNTRFEINIADMKGGNMPPNAATQMKAMGMDQVVTISLPEKKVAYMIYPGLQSYVELQTPTAEVPTNSGYKMEATVISKDTVDGHPCVENKVVVTDKDGVKHESTVWNATDLKSFPVKIQTTEQGTDVTMLFKNVSLAKPAASSFELPSGYAAYQSMQALMQVQIMKRMGGGGMGGPPPGQ